MCTEYYMVNNVMLEFCDIIEILKKLLHYACVNNIVKKYVTVETYGFLSLIKHCHIDHISLVMFEFNLDMLGREDYYDEQWFIPLDKADKIISLTQKHVTFKTITGIPVSMIRYSYLA